MEQARSYVCKQCASPVPPSHKFCGACGATVPLDVQQRQVEYFGTMQTPGKARLVLIRGDQGVAGVTYLLHGSEHVAGRQDAQILFPEDTWLSPKHANFLYRGESLVVRDEGSVNGVFIRAKQPVELGYGEHFLCGQQLFRVDATPKDTSGPDPDQTFFYSSPKHPSPFRVVQLLAGGAEGMVFCAGDGPVVIGREDADMNFPDDSFLSGNHVKVEPTERGCLVTDLGSKNGTFVRVRGEAELAHSDYVFMGRQLLRVEMTT